MKVTIDIEIQPFLVPDYIPVSGGNLILLSELDEGTLARLCNNFKKAVFEKAGKEIPSYVSYEDVSKLADGAAKEQNG